MKTKFLFTLALLFSVLMLQGQVFGPPKDANIPKDYWKQLDKQEKAYVKKAVRSQKKAQRGDADFYVSEVSLPNIQNTIQGEYNYSRASLQIPENESKFKFSRKVDVAIIDTGEPDNKYVTKYKGAKESITYVGGSVVDGNFHATHVGGSIVANVNGKLIGIARATAEAGYVTMTYYKVCNDNGGCYYQAIESAIRDYTKYYIDVLKPAEVDGVINMSLGGSSIPSSLEDAMREAVEAGIAIFAAAGNNGQNKVSCPGCSQYTYAIAANDKDDKKANFSNFGKEITFSGPGVNVPSTCLGDGAICNASGTSMSTPQVAGVYILLKAQKPEWNATETINFMVEHATDKGVSGWDEEYGHGIPKMSAYMEHLGDDQPDPPSCNDGKQNGKETGIDCGGDCPPCESEPDEPEVVFPERIITVKLNGKWRSLWVEAKSASKNSSEAVAFHEGNMIGVNTYGKDELDLNSVFAAQTKYGWITITDWEIRIKTTKDAEITAKELKEAIDETWNGRRGVGISAPADFASGAYWTAYFTDLLLDRYPNGKLEITVEKITFNNEKGEVLVFTSKDLQQWPRGSKPLYSSSYDNGMPVDFGLYTGESGVVYYTDDPNNNKDIEQLPRVWTITAEWGEEESTTVDISAPGLPTFKDVEIKYFDSKGVYTYGIKSSSYPRESLIKRRPPFGQDSWELVKIIKIEKPN